jgi:lipopolysaccharide export system protein LptA
MKPPFFSLLLMAALTVGTGLAHAEKADRDQPMNVEADALRHDDLKQTSVFTGRVVLTKGTILIRGDRIEVRQDDAGNQFGVVTPAPGQLAFFRQKREGVDEFIEGEGERIEYDSQADTVKFIGRAQMRRYRGATLGDELTGGVIVYSNTTDVFSIDSAAAKAGAPPGRVRAMMTPQPEPASSAPARAPVLPGPALRPSNTLRGEQK